MNNIFCSCAVALLAIGFSTTAQADILFHNNTSSIKIESKPNPNSISKPNSSIKLASVQFLSDANNVSFDSGNIDIKTQCIVSGYVLPVKNCNVLNKNSGILCPLNSGEHQYTDKCCDKIYDKTEGTNCSNNAVLSSDYCLRGAANSAVKYYKCECPESAYPYAQDDDCPAGHRIDYDPSKTCEVNGVKRYSTCIPKSYLDCSKEGSINGVKGLLGNYGTGYGYLQDGTIVFAECRCPTDYSNYGCSTFLLSSDVCKNDGRTYYKDGDCYSGCTDASLYDADYYYKQSALRCLFDYNTEEKTYSNLININKTNTDKALCTRVVNGQEQVSRQTCAEMGYVYSEDECPDKDNLLIRCPSDTSKVWCMNANGCMNYPVGGSACNEGAKVSYCGSDNTRCVYDDNTCNKNWNEGIRNGSYAGSTSLCCKEGWDYIDGVCTPHDCGDVDYLYPYGDRYPLVEVAEGGASGISSCKSGNKTYYGYKQCKGCAYGDTYTSNTCTDLWQPSVDNPHRCVCKTTGLPYDRNTLYTQGGSGNLGVMKTCVDPDATYYGYDYCYRWYAMGYSGGVATGKCGNTSCSSVTYPYESTIVTESVSVSGVCSAEDEARCANGNDEACRTCTDANSPYVIICNFGTAASASKGKYYGYKTCPPERPYQAYTYICYNKCAFGSADCKRGDAVFYPDVASGKFIGTVIKVVGNKVYLMGPKQGSYTWEEARTAGANYYPEGLENDANVGKGKWYLMRSINYVDIGYYFYTVHRRVFEKEGSSWGMYYWIDEAKDDNYAYVIWEWGKNPYLKTSKNPMVPMMIYQIP